MLKGTQQSLRVSLINTKNKMDQLTGHLKARYEVPRDLYNETIFFSHTQMSLSLIAEMFEKIMDTLTVIEMERRDDGEGTEANQS